MNNILEIIEGITSSISKIVWPMFLPVLLLAGLYISINTIFKVKKYYTHKSAMRVKDMIGPASISLGAMIGTGAIIGVLGALNSLTENGQSNIEAMAIWALIGSLILIPLSYSETFISKMLGKQPKEYISLMLSPSLGKLYGISFIILYIFGFGGFQFSGIDATVTIIANRFMGIELHIVQRYLYVVIPLIIIASTIILTKKHDLFINSMTFMIGIAVAIYMVFFLIFLVRTRSHIPLFMEGVVKGMANPVSMLLGVPLGLILGLQRVIQTAESGLGALAMAAHESESKPRAAALISIIPATVTVVAAIVVTSYITSYGVAEGHINLPSDGLNRLIGYFETAVKVTGGFGLVVLSLFTILSGLTTLLGSYYFLSVLLETSENTNIAIYIVLISIAGTLAVFGFEIVFDIVDLLLFLVSGIHILALVKLVSIKDMGELSRKFA